MPRLGRLIKAVMDYFPALGPALKYYERAVKVNPQYADAENNIGTIWYQRKKYGKAIRSYQRAIKLKGDMAVRSPSTEV